MSLNRIADFVIGVPLVKLLSLIPSTKPTTPANIRKILIIKLAAAGDTILLGMLMKSFRDKHTDAEIHWLVSPINATLARTVPEIDKFLVWSGGKAAVLPLISQLRAERYDAVIDLEQWSRGTVLISYFSGAPIRVGFDTPGQHRANLFTKSYRKQFDRHELFDFMEVLSLLGRLPGEIKVGMTVTEEGKSECEIKAPFLKEKKFRVLLHPGCGSDGLPREWPLEKYAVLAHWLVKKFDAQIVLTSGPEESKKTCYLNKLLKNIAKDMGGKISWLGLAALVDQMDFVVSGNTGVMHMAAALKKKQVALHGPTNPLFWGPLNPNAEIIQSSCSQCPCLKLGFEYHTTDQSCMQKIDVETVKAAISRLIDK